LLLDELSELELGELSELDELVSNGLLELLLGVLELSEVGELLLDDVNSPTPPDELLLELKNELEELVVS